MRLKPSSELGRKVAIMRCRRGAAVVLVPLLVEFVYVSRFRLRRAQRDAHGNGATRGDAGNNQADMVFGGDADAVTVAGMQACRPKRNWFESVVGANPGPATILIDDITPNGESHFKLACRDGSLFQAT